MLPDVFDEGYVKLEAEITWNPPLMQLSERIGIISLVIS